MHAYVGSRTTHERNARGEGIGIFEIDVATGALTLLDVVRELINPSYLAMSAAGDFLYTVHGDGHEISAFSVDGTTGRLRFINRQDTQGHNPVHLALDPTGRFVVVTNHLGASLAVLPVNGDGSLGVVEQLVTLEGPIGPHRVEQQQAKPHFNPFDPSGRFVVVPDKGLDRVVSYRFEDGRLRPLETSMAAQEGAGPRHLAFHPNAPFAYVVNELASSVTACRFAAETGELVPFQVLPSLPDTFTGNSRAAGIQVDAFGRFVYASNRGFDSIAVFAIDAATGALRFVEAVATQGRTPRFFTLSPDGRFMFALNEDSDAIVTLAVDAESGRLRPTGASVAFGSPVCMVFSP